MHAGDTLRTIARGAWGDSQLWYRIADANGISSDRELRVGQTLKIPNAVGTVHNDADSFKPYDPSKITGDTTPNLPAPNNNDDCGGLGQILMAVVAIAVTVLTYGALTGVNAVVAGAISGAAGAAASQVVGNVTGVMDGFDWKAVALGALGGAVTGGLTDWLPLGSAGGAVPNAVVRAAVGNAMTQGVAVATGLQREFSWRGVAVAAVSAGVGEALGDEAVIDGRDRLVQLDNGQLMRNYGTGAFAGLAKQGPLGQLAARTLTGLATAGAATLARGGRVSTGQIAVDAFGNALGQSLVDATVDNNLQQQREARSESIRELNRIRSGLESHQAAMIGDTYTGGLDWADDVRSRRVAATSAWTGSGSTSSQDSGAGYSSSSLGAASGVSSRLASPPEFRLDGAERTSVAGSYGGGYTTWEQVSPQRVEITYHRGALAKADQVLAGLIDGIDSAVQRVQDEGDAAYARGDRLSAAMAAVSYLPDRLVGDSLKAVVSLPRLYTSNDMLRALVRAASNPLATARVGYDAFLEMSTQDKIVAAVELLGPAALKLGPGALKVGNTGSAGSLAVGETPPLLTLSRQPGTVTRNALSDAEFAQAQDLASFRGGKFVGAPTDSFPGIDGWLDGVPTQMKIVTGNGEQAVLRNIVKSARNMSAQGYVGDIAVDATRTGISVDGFAKFVTPNTPVGRILNEGSVNNVYVKFGDGWLNITQGTLVVPGR